MDQVGEGNKGHLHHLLDSYRPFQTYPSYHLAAIVEAFEVSSADVAAATSLLNVGHSFEELVGKIERNHYALLVVDQRLGACVFLSNLEPDFADFDHQEKNVVLPVA